MYLVLKLKFWFISVKQYIIFLVLNIRKNPPLRWTFHGILLIQTTGPSRTVSEIFHYQWLFFFWGITIKLFYLTFQGKLTELWEIFSHSAQSSAGMGGTDDKTHPNVFSLCSRQHLIWFPDMGGKVKYFFFKSVERVGQDFKTSF